jgi:hypothetical protein
MKLSVSQLRRIIKEEVSRMLVMEAGYKEEESEYYGPGDEPPGYKLPEAQGVPDLEEQFKAWYEKLKVDRPDFTKGDVRVDKELKYATHYMIKGDKLYLLPGLYDAIENQLDGKGGSKLLELKKLFPGGVVSGLPKAGGSTMSETRSRTLRRR